MLWEYTGRHRNGIVFETADSLLSGILKDIGNTAKMATATGAGGTLALWEA